VHSIGISRDRGSSSPIARITGCRCSTRTGSS
jgi:hypothetical protein